MDPAITLFLLRLLSAVVLLAFLGLLIWFSYQDIQATTHLLDSPQRIIGTLHVISSESSSPATGTRFPLLPIVSIGRSPGNTIVLEDEYASSEHALILAKGQQLWLEDLGSRNGTLLNDVPVRSPTVITAGDVITVGRTLLKFEL